jgi:hypothetical protein
MPQGQRLTMQAASYGTLLRLLPGPEWVDTSSVRASLCRVGRAGIAMALVVGLAPVAAPPAWAFRGADGEILLTTGASPQLVAVAADGSGSTPLGPGRAGSWFPTGGQIVFELGGDLHLMRADGFGRRGLTSGADVDGEPSSSPDGDRVVFVREDSGMGQPGLWVLRVDGGGLSPLAGTAGSPSAPRWSPDGRTILFTADGGGQTDLFAVDALGGEPANLTSSPEDEGSAAWSPDGGWIAFTAPTGAGQWGLFVMDVWGSVPTELFVSDEALDAPAWAPSGGRIAVASGGTTVLVILVTDPSSPSVAASGLTGVTHLDWQPQCTLRGTSRADVLVGTPGPDLICGMGGPDTIRGRGGADSIFGGRGADDIQGGDGRDVLVGGPGADRIEGDGGDDMLTTRDGVARNDAAGGGGGADLCRAERDDWCRDDGSSMGGTVSPLDQRTRNRMTGSSWRRGCPVPLRDLRYLRLNHRDFAGLVRRGELVVHEDHAGRVLRAMERLWQARFPMRRMRLVDDYGGDDDRSMAANNTSAFNCRSVVGGSGWSQHAYGWAIDVNPVQNPFVMSDGTVLPPAGRAYVDRSWNAPGMIHRGDVVVRAFASIGWEWGGNWPSSKDYQHFSATGR